MRHSVSVSSALREAQSVIEREQTIRLSVRDSERLLELLEKPDKPNACFNAAMKRYQCAKLAGAANAFDWQP